MLDGCGSSRFNFGWRGWQARLPLGGGAGDASGIGAARTVRLVS
jgi:hypothetical protein